MQREWSGCRLGWNDGEAKFALVSIGKINPDLFHTLAAIANFRTLCYDTATCLLHDLGKSACDVGITSKTHTYTEPNVWSGGANGQRGGCMFSIFITFLRPGTNSASMPRRRALNWPRFVIPEPTDEIIRTDGNNEQRHCRFFCCRPTAISLENGPYENKRPRGPCFLR